MKKKALSVLPWIHAKRQSGEQWKRKRGTKGIITAERLDVAGKDTLVINCFK